MSASALRPPPPPPSGAAAGAAAAAAGGAPPAWPIRYTVPRDSRSSPPTTGAVRLPPTRTAASSSPLYALRTRSSSADASASRPSGGGPGPPPPGRSGSAPDRRIAPPRPLRASRPRARSTDPSSSSEPATPVSGERSTPSMTTTPRASVAPPVTRGAASGPATERVMFAEPDSHRKPGARLPTRSTPPSFTTSDRSTPSWPAAAPPLPLPPSALPSAAAPASASAGAAAAACWAAAAPVALGSGTVPASLTQPEPSAGARSTSTDSTFGGREAGRMGLRVRWNECRSARWDGVAPGPHRPPPRPPSPRPHLLWRQRGVGDGAREARAADGAVLQPQRHRAAGRVEGAAERAAQVEQPADGGACCRGGGCGGRGRVLRVGRRASAGAGHRRRSAGAHQLPRLAARMPRDLPAPDRPRAHP
jgi:hypothetical protein